MSRDRYDTTEFPMEWRPCIPLTSSTRPDPQFDCLHYVDPESGEDMNTWDAINVAYPDFTERLADRVDLDPEDYSFDELARRLDRLATDTGRHVVDVMYELGDDGEPPSEELLLAIVGARPWKRSGWIRPPGAHPPGLLERVNRDRAARGQRALAPDEWSTADLEEFVRHIQNPENDKLKRKLMGGQPSLFSFEQEGFALVSPKGKTWHCTPEPQGSQEALLDVGKPDRKKMEELRKRELEERAVKKKKRRKKGKKNPAPPPKSLYEYLKLQASKGVTWKDDGYFRRLRDAVDKKLRADSRFYVFGGPFHQDEYDYVWEVGEREYGPDYAVHVRFTPDGTGVEVFEIATTQSVEDRTILVPQGEIDAIAEIVASVVGGKGLPRASRIPQGDLDVINRHRRGLGMGPLDPDAGWTVKELADMAESIRKTGVMANPRTSELKRKLMR